MTKRDRNMAIAWMLLFGFAVMAFCGICDAATWEDMGDGYRMCVIDAKIDAEERDKAFKAMNVVPNAITTTHDKTIIIFNPDSPWGILEDWAEGQE